MILLKKKKYLKNRGEGNRSYLNFLPKVFPLHTCSVSSLLENPRIVDVCLVCIQYSYIRFYIIYMLYILWFFI